MNDRLAFMRAVRGPLVLITLGILFLLDQQSDIRFYRTWPLLLIVIGILKLAERLVAPGNPQGVPPPPPGPGSY